MNESQTQSNTTLPRPELISELRDAMATLLEDLGERLNKWRDTLQIINHIINGDTTFITLYVSTSGTKVLVNTIALPAIELTGFSIPIEEFNQEKLRAIVINHLDKVLAKFAEDIKSFTEQQRKELSKLLGN